MPGRRCCGRSLHQSRRSLIRPLIRATGIESDDSVADRFAVDGKHFSVAGKPVRTFGVTYGSFAARADGAEFPEPEQLRLDFAAIAAAGLTVVQRGSGPSSNVSATSRLGGRFPATGLRSRTTRMARAGRAARARGR